MAEEQSERISDADSKPCPRCAETIKRAAEFCRFCGANIQAYVEAKDAQKEKMLHEGHPAVIYSAWQWLVIVLTLGTAYFYYAGKSLAIRYQISTQRIKIERGIVSKVKDSNELFTIEHIDIISPLGMRLLGHCILQLRSTDNSYNLISVYGIDGLENLADTLRECSLRERTRRGILSVRPN